MRDPDEALVCVSMSDHGLSGPESIESTKAIISSLVGWMLQGKTVHSAAVVQAGIEGGLTEKQ